MMPLTGTVALVTGASRGIGRACAETLAVQGAAVVVNFLNSPDAASDVASGIIERGGRAIAVRADVSDRDDVVAMMDVIGEQFGRLDVIVSNAAAGGFRPLMQATPASFDSIVRMNAAPLIWLVQAGVPLMGLDATGGGLAGLTSSARQTHTSGSAGTQKKVIAISSHGSFRGIANYGAIGASKAALESLVRHFALELGRDGVTFNAVMPGIVETDAIRTLPGAAGMLESVKDQILIRNRMLQPQDVADTVAFLAGPRSDLIQGQVIVVDGGISIRV